MASDTKRNAPCSIAMSNAYSGPKFASWSSQKPGLLPYELLLLERYDIPKDASFLVIGAGNGRETFGIYDAGYHDVRGVDVTAKFVDLANAQSREKNLGVEFLLAPADRLPFPENRFSVVTMFANLYAHFTPRSARLAALNEAKRVLKPGGLLLLEAANLRHSYRHWFYIRLSDIVHRFYNPWKLEKCDKLMREASQMNLPAPEMPRTHWFQPHEIDAEAHAVSMEVVQATTIQGVQNDPSASATNFHHMGRLLYVLRKPNESNHDNQ